MQSIFKICKVTLVVRYSTRMSRTGRTENNYNLSNVPFLILFFIFASWSFTLNYKFLLKLSFRVF